MKALGVVNFILIAVTTVYLLSQKNAIFKEEITVKRINIIGEAGELYMVLSNPENQVLATNNGQSIQPNQQERGVPGMIFFNGKGDEVGGLVFGMDDEGTYQMLTFDQYQNDQIMVLRKDEVKERDEWKRRYGLEIKERSEKPSHQVMAELAVIDSIQNDSVRESALDKFWSKKENKAPTKLFLGRTFSGLNGLFLLNDDHESVLSIYVDQHNKPYITYQADDGKTHHLIEQNHIGSVE